MPTQNFSLNVATAPLASVHWSPGFGSIDLVYSGALLTRITDAQGLRTTGLQGKTADGATIVLRLIGGPDGEMFEVERNGARMYPGPVDLNGAATWTSMSPAAYGQSGPTGHMGPMPAQEKAMRSGRRWVRAVGILLVLGGLACLILSAGETTSVVTDGGGTMDKAVKMGDRYVDAAALRGIGIGVGVFGILLILIARFARGQRAKLMFGIGATLCLLLAAANVLGGSPIGGVIPGLAGVSAIRAWKAAKAVGTSAP